MKKTMQEQMEEIRKSNLSIAEKKVALIKIGCRPRDIEYLEFKGWFDSETPLTFGVEMECYNCRYDDIVRRQGEDFSFVWEGYNHHDRRGVYKFTTDCSISGNDPRECVSPILDDTTDGFKSLETCCSILNGIGAMVNKSCGLHVHVGLQGFSGKAIVNIYKNYQKLEALIDSFMAPSRRENCRWAQSISGYDFSDCSNATDVYNRLHGDRYHKVNPCAYGAHGTVEFRQHQGTLDYKKISMWVHFCCKLVNYSKENVLSFVPQSIWDVPFLNTEEKEFFEGRINHFMGA